MSKLLWKPSIDQINSSNMMNFIHFINKNKKLSFTSYNDLYQYSVNNPIDFWDPNTLNLSKFVSSKEIRIIKPISNRFVSELLYCYLPLSIKLFFHTCK